MARFLDRYLHGECEQVWDELYELEDQVREEPYYSEALAVARETMRRVRRNCEILIPRLQSIGYQFGYAWADGVYSDDIETEPPLLGVPLPDIQQRLDLLEEAGAVLPLSLRAFYEIVGAINFVGVCTPAVDRFEYGEDAVVDEDMDILEVDEQLNPLYVQGLEEDLSPETYRIWRHEEEAPYTLVVTHDSVSKYFRSDGGSYLIELPCYSIDAHLLFEYGYDQTFVQYLRYNIKRGGLAGLPEAPGLPDKALAYVTRELLPL